MALALVIIGLLLVLSGARGTAGALGNQVAQDGSGFVYWLAAIFIIGAVGYSPKLNRFSHYMLALVFVVFVIGNPTVFTQIQAALGSIQDEPNDAPTGAASSSSGGGGNALGGVGSFLSGLGSVATFFGG